MREKWDLPWEAGSYHRTTLCLNPAVVSWPTSGLPPSYSHKALLLKHVDPDMAWYAAINRSVVESLLPLPGSEVDLLETSVVFARVRRRYGTNVVVLEIFGLTP